MGKPAIVAPPATADDVFGVPAERWFDVLSALSLPAWILLAVAPKWRATQELSLLPVYTYGLAYTLLLGTYVANSEVSLDAFGSLGGIAAVFENKIALLAGWVHYLAFDLLAGRAITRDAIQHQVPHLLLLPCLFLTLMAGPFGWLLYQVVRRVYG